MSNDLRNIDSRSKEILLNRYVKMPLFSRYKIKSCFSTLSFVLFKGKLLPLTKTVWGNKDKESKRYK